MNKTFTLTILLFVWIFISNAFAQNEQILSAMSPYEDLTEFALAAEASEMNKTIGSLNAATQKLRGELPAQVLSQLQLNTQKLATAAKNKDYPAVALVAVDAYKLLAENLNVSKLEVPLEVTLLDYVGFKTQALLMQRPIDWPALQQVALEARGDWEKISPSVKNHGLNDAVQTAITGLQQAVTVKNPQMLHFAAQVDLDLVDLLEGFFERKK